MTAKARFGVKVSGAIGAREGLLARVDLPNMYLAGLLLGELLVALAAPERFLT